MIFSANEWLKIQKQTDDSKLREQVLLIEKKLIKYFGKYTFFLFCGYKWMAIVLHAHLHTPASGYARWLRK